MMTKEILVSFVFICSVAPSLQAQNPANEFTVGDTVVTIRRVDLYPRPGWMPSSAALARFDGGDSLIVRKVKTSPSLTELYVQHDTLGGWIGTSSVRSLSKIQEYCQEQPSWNWSIIERSICNTILQPRIEARREALAAERRRAEERERQRQEQHEKYVESLREKGYTIALSGMSFAKSSADGIDVSFELENIGQEKTIKYLYFSLQLYNAVGDPVDGRFNPSAQTVRGVGPISPGEIASYKFESVWHANTGTCAELAQIVILYMDGSSFTLDAELPEVAAKASPMKLENDCPYRR